MSTAQDYLNAAIAAPAEQKGSDFGFETIARVKTDFGLFCYIKSDSSLSEFFPYADLSNDVRSSILRNAKSYIKEHGSRGDFPSDAIRITIYGNEVLTAKNGSWSGDWIETVGAYYSKTNVFTEGTSGISRDLWGKPKVFKNLDPEVREKLEGQDLLYDIVMNSLQDTEAQTFLKPMWAKIKEVVDPVILAKDERTESYTDKDGEEQVAFKKKRVKLVKVYQNKAMAQVAADEILAAFSDSPSTSALSLSATATIANWTLKSLQDEAENLHKLVAGRPVKVVKDVLTEWGLEPPDLKLINIEVPF